MTGELFCTNLLVTRVVPQVVPGGARELGPGDRGIGPGDRGMAPGGRGIVLLDLI